MSKTRVSDTPRGSRNAAVSVAVTATLSGFVTHPEETYPLGNPLRAETMALDDSLGHVSKTRVSDTPGGSRNAASFGCSNFNLQRV